MNGQYLPFREALTARDRFIVTVELVPGRGSRGKTHQEVIEFAEKAAQGGVVHALSVTDNPGGHPALSPDVIGLEIARMGIAPVIHFTCKDKNRNQIESILYALDRIGLRNLLVMTGDYPLYGFEGKAKPVYDLDSVQVLRLVTRMNQGLEIDSKAPGGGRRLPPTEFFKGCVVCPFKQNEAEVMTQYYKLSKKILAGADFVITQLGFDARKFDELLRYMRLLDLTIPVLGNVYILRPGVARAINAKRVPGCVVTDRLNSTIAEEARLPDGGRSASLTRAGKLIAVLKGLGYDGAHIGGPGLNYAEFETVLDIAKGAFDTWRSLVPEFDYPQDNGFYLFERDPRTGLNADTLSSRQERPGRSPGYSLMRLLHHAAFTPGAGLYNRACCFFRFIDGTRIEKPLAELEYLIKFVTSHCRRCGDCTLADLAFLCPQSQCPKFLFNGPCGGSAEGWCEVFPGKRQCVYVRAYRRLKAYGEEKQLEGDCILPRDWGLDQTSSWANYFLGKDHRRWSCMDPHPKAP